MNTMRTTITLDDDIVAKIEIVCEERNLSFKQAVNLLLRQGLDVQLQQPLSKRYKRKPRKLGLRSGFDPVKLNQLVDELEVDALQETLTKL